MMDSIRNFRGSFVVRLLQGLWAVIIMGLVGSMIALSFWNQIPPKGGNAAEVNYCMFCATFTLVSLAVCIPLTVWVTEETETRNSFIILVFDALNLIFYFSGAVAMAAAMGVHSCKNENYTTNNRITNTTDNTAYRCREAQAVTAFLWISFLTYVFSTVVSYFTASTTNAKVDHAGPHELSKNGSHDLESSTGGGVVPGTLDMNPTSSHDDYRTDALSSSHLDGYAGTSGFRNNGPRPMSSVSDIGEPSGIPGRSYHGNTHAVSVDSSSVVSR